jgi:hypothetical protein
LYQSVEVIELFTSLAERRKSPAAKSRATKERRFLLSE